MLVCLLLHAILLSFRSAEVCLIGSARSLGDDWMFWWLQACSSRFSAHLHLLILHHLFIGVSNYSKGRWRLLNVHIHGWLSLLLVKVVQWGHHTSWLCLVHLSCRLVLHLHEGEMLGTLLRLWSLELVSRGWSIAAVQRWLASFADLLRCRSPACSLLLLTWGKKGNLLFAIARSVFGGSFRGRYELWSHRVHTLIAVIWGLIEGYFGLRLANC